MARFQKSFSMKIEGKVDARVKHAYEELESLAACAGIKGNYDEAQKARMNHHGWVMTTKKGQVFVPARRFVDAFVNNSDFAEAGESIKALIKDNLRAPEDREWETAIRRTAQGGYDLVPIDKRGTKPFGTRNIGARRLMNKIAQSMEAAQVSVIGSTLLPENTESVIKRKGRNSPLLNKGTMRSSVTHWVEDVFSENVLENIEAEGFE